MSDWEEESEVPGFVPASVEGKIGYQSPAAAAPSQKPRGRARRNQWSNDEQRTPGGGSSWDQDGGSSSVGWGSSWSDRDGRNSSTGRGSPRDRDRENPHRGTRGPRRDQSPSDDVHMTIDCSFIGRIVGKGGSRIKEMQDMTQARIKIHRARDGEQETDVQISGSEEAKEKAREMIEEIISSSSSSSRDRGGGGRGGHGRGFQDSNRSSMFPTESAPSAPRINWSQLNANRAEIEAAKWEGLPPVNKDFYREEPEIATWSSVEVERFREDKNGITVKDLSSENRDVPNPVRSFVQAFRVYPDILEEIKKAKFVEPTPIQVQLL